MVMWNLLLRIGAAIAFTIQVVSAQSAEAAHSNKRPIPTTDDFGFSAAPATKGSYKSYRYDFGNGQTENAGTAQSATDEATAALSTARMLKGLYQFSDPSWQFKPSIDADF